MAQIAYVHVLLNWWWWGRLKAVALVWDSLANLLMLGSNTLAWDAGIQHSGLGCRLHSHLTGMVCDCCNQSCSAQ
jgi:hypothetical protein